MRELCSKNFTPSHEKGDFLQHLPPPKFIDQNNGGSSSLICILSGSRSVSVKLTRDRKGGRGKT